MHLTILQSGTEKLKLLTLHQSGKEMLFRHYCTQFVMCLGNQVMKF